VALTESFPSIFRKNPLLKKMETHPYRQSPVPRYTETYLKYLPTELRRKLRLLKESCTFRIHVDFEKDSNIMTIEDSLFRMKFSIDQYFKEHFESSHKSWKC
jgi:hypothetical protein